jgi:hypothetical protein
MAYSVRKSDLLTPFLVLRQCSYFHRITEAVKVGRIYVRLLTRFLTARWLAGAVLSFVLGGQVSGGRRLARRAVEP